MPAIQASRYGIYPYDLRLKAMTLSIGQGSADRFNSPDSMRFILEGELWAESQVSDYVATPLKPVAPPPGLTAPTFTAVPIPSVPESPDSATMPSYSPEVAVTQQGTKWNYPLEFIDAVIYKAISEMLKSEFFEVEPNKTEATVEAENRAYTHIWEFRTRTTSLVGAGRRRNPNPHIPPMIAPKGTIPGSGMNGAR